VITTGRYLDMLLKKRSVANFTSLYRLRSEAALVNVRKHGGYVPAALLRMQEEIFLEPGSIIPCDSYVLEGLSTVDESTMTGESVPAPKSVGDTLIAGTRNLSASMIAVVYREQQDSSLEQLIESISLSTEQKLRSQESVETLTTHFVSIVLCLTAVGFCYALWYSSPALAVVERINVACERAMAILAAACPCAPGLAIPSATMAGIDAAWSRGILLVGGARTIEDVSQLTHLVMDKTGTLTEGRL
jgi:Cu+-exporting ATPase